MPLPQMTCGDCQGPFERRSVKGPAPLYCGPCKLARKRARQRKPAADRAVVVPVKAKVAAASGEVTMPPPPKLNPARANSRVGPLKLPAEGRQGDAPVWPLMGQTVAEGDAWDQLWATPQAVAWERMGWTRTVARYCRVMVEAELPDADPGARSEARQLEDRLGLTPKAMRVLLWEIVADEVADQRRQTGTSARRRIKAV